MRFLSIPILAAAVLLAALSTPPACAAPAEFDAELLAIQQGWAEANYRSANHDSKERAFASLEQRTAAFVNRYPDRAEPLVWEGIVLSTHAGAKGGLGALSLAKRSRQKLEAAMKIDPATLEGSAYTSLGTLYYKVPGFPLGFGDRKKAESNLQQALQLNPDGIDPNFFYGEFLFEQGRYAEAMRHLEKASNAPSRANRHLADQGRHQEILALMTRVKGKLG